MIAARALTPPGEVLSTWTEVRTRFPNQWVVLIATDWIDNHNLAFRSTRVVAHDDHRAKALAEAAPITSRSQSFACFFTGRFRGPLPRL
jgi:hypothetical protein